MKNHSCMVYDRLKEIVPVENLENLSKNDLKKHSKIALEILGISPQNLEESVDKTLEFYEKNPQKSNVSLFEFVYQVWRFDNDILQ